MAPHPEGHAFDQVRFLFPDTILPYAPDRIIHRQHIVPVDLYALHTITFGLFH